MTRILVVDDEPGVRDLLRDALRDRGLRDRDGLQRYRGLRRASPAPRRPVHRGHQYADHERLRVPGEIARTRHPDSGPTAVGARFDGDVAKGYVTGPTTTCENLSASKSALRVKAILRRSIPEGDEDLRVRTDVDER